MSQALTAPIIAPRTAVGTCLHCGLPVRRAGAEFCCAGCQAVYRLIQDRGLGDFYRLRSRTRGIGDTVPAAGSEASDFRYLDDPEFQRLYGCGEPAADGTRRLKLYLEGAHCAACVWITEKVPSWVPGALSVRLDLSRSIATVTIGSRGSFAQVASELLKLGYRPHPVRDDEGSELRAREDRRTLARLAVAGAGSANIMLLSASIYAGLEGGLARVFEWASFALYVPVVLFAGYPFFATAFRSLLARQVSIDIPIALGLTIATVVSVFNLLQGGHLLYFDSASALIFLLMASRFLLRKAQGRALAANQLIHFLSPATARRCQGGRSELVPLQALQAGDLIEVRPGEQIPADGRVETGESSIGCALLTGESRPVPCGAGTAVFAGTRNEAATLQVRVTASGGATRLGGILSSIEESLSRRAPIVGLTEKVARIFVLNTLAALPVVFGLAYSTGGWALAFNEVLALSLVTCPCAFALATPLAFSQGLARCARRGILVKGADVLERLSRVDQVIFDKTGTLTRGDFSVESWKVDDQAHEAEITEAVRQLEARSQHGVALALLRHLGEPRSEAGVSEFREKLGWGVQGSIEGHRYEICRDAEAAREGTAIVVLRDGKPVARAGFGEELNPDAAAAVQALRKLGIQVSILSGDSPGAVARAANALGIAPEAWAAERSPEQKLQAVREAPHALMVGDGANDAAALAAAHVGLSVRSGMEVSLRAAGAFSLVPGVAPVAELISISRETLHVVRRNLLFSFAYNVVATYAAVRGLIPPLLAAVLMPASALLLFVSSMIGTRELRRLGRASR